MQFNLLKCLKMPVILATFIAVAVGLSGCAGTDVHLDVPGLRGVKLGGKQKEKKVAARGGLVIPPSTKKLPNPNEIASRSQQEEQAWPDDPDERKKKIAALKKKREKNAQEGVDEKGNPIFGEQGEGQRGILDKLLKGDLFKGDDDEE